MNEIFRRMLSLLLTVTAVTAHGQAVAGYKDHGASISVGGTGQFSKIITALPGVNNNIPYGAVYATSQEQFTTGSAGFLTSFQFHPKYWAGVELNYGFNHYSERYQYALTTVPASSGQVSVTPDVHEFTGAYLFHVNRIPYKPFVGLGGGALDFTPAAASNQIRGAALGEIGVDLPAAQHIAFRVGGRSLFYRSPNFYTPQISTDTWRATIEPTISAIFKY